MKITSRTCSLPIPALKPKKKTKIRSLKSSQKTVKSCISSKLSQQLQCAPVSTNTLNNDTTIPCKKYSMKLKICCGVCFTIICICCVTYFCTTTSIMRLSSSSPPMIPYIPMNTICAPYSQHQIMVHNVKPTQRSSILYNDQVPTFSMNLHMFQYKDQLNRLSITNACTSSSAIPSSNYELDSPHDLCSYNQACTNGPQYSPEDPTHTCCSTNIAEFPIEITGTKTCSSFVWHNSMPQQYCKVSNKCAPCRKDLNSQALAVSPCFTNENGKSVVLYQCMAQMLVNVSCVLDASINNQNSHQMLPMTKSMSGTIYPIQKGVCECVATSVQTSSVSPFPQHITSDHVWPLHSKCTQTCSDMFGPQFVSMGYEPCVPPIGFPPCSSTSLTFGVPTSNTDSLGNSAYVIKYMARTCAQFSNVQIQVPFTKLSKQAQCPQNINPWNIQGTREYYEQSIPQQSTCCTINYISNTKYANCSSISNVASCDTRSTIPQIINK